MSSPQLHNQSTPSRGTNVSRGRRYAILAAIAASFASAGAGLATVVSDAPAATAHTLSGPVALPVPHGGATSSSFVRRMRALEAAGYVEVFCKVDGDLMLNPRTHRYLTVRH